MAGCVRERFSAAREKLDNLIFVINCNLQRLDGPVRGNGKIIQELEGIFRGAGWNVLKVIWGTDWDPLFAKDYDGLLVRPSAPEVRMHGIDMMRGGGLDAVARAAYGSAARAIDTPAFRLALEGRAA